MNTMQKMRVVVNYLGRKGGGMVYAYEMTKGLIANGCEVYAIVPETIGNLSKWEQLELKELVTVKTYSDKISFIGGTVRFILSDMWKLKRHFKDIPMDVCYVPMLQPWTMLVNYIFRGSKLVTTIHDPRAHDGSSWVGTALNHRVTQNSDKVIILSETFRAYTTQTYKIADHDIYTIPHGVFDYYEKISINNAEAMKAKTNFLFFGRIEPYKGLALLAQAYGRLKNEGYDVSLRIVGNGSLGELYDTFSEMDDVQIDNRFVPDEEVYQYFRGERIVTVLPYITATQSGVIPIAMQAGAQIVATDTGGLREQTGDGKYAILCSPDSEDIYNAMKKAILRYDEYADMRKRAEEYVQTLSWNHLAQKLVAAFED